MRRLPTVGAAAALLRLSGQQQQPPSSAPHTRPYTCGGYHASVATSVRGGCGAPSNPVTSSARRRSQGEGGEGEDGAGGVGGVSACAGGLVFRRTPALLKDVRRGDRGDSRRLTFEERAERRSGKTRQQRESREQLQAEAELMVTDDFPGALEDIYARVAAAANTSALKVLNMAMCLEQLEVEVPGGRTVTLGSVAQVVRLSPTTLEVTPSAAALATPVLQAVSRFDSTLGVTKQGGGNGHAIRVQLPPVTTARRARAAKEIEHQIGLLRTRARQARTSAGKVIQDAGLNDGVAQELTAELDKIVHAFVEEKAAELQLTAEEVMSMGVEESDGGEGGGAGGAPS